MARRAMACTEVDGLAGLYVLDALGSDEAAAVSAHLEGCPEAHASFAELAEASSSLPATVEPVSAPDELRSRVLAAIESTPQVPDAVPGAVVDGQAARAGERSSPRPIPLAPTIPSGRGRHPIPGQARWRRRWPLAGLAVAAVLVIAVVGGAALLQRASDAEARLALLRHAIAAASDPASNVASLVGSGAAAGASGFAVFPADGSGLIVVEGLPGVASDEVYQAWYLAGGVPTSAGIVSMGDDDLAILTGLEPVPGTDTIALTVEAAPGAQAPTSTPIVVGELRMVAIREGGTTSGAR